MTTPNSPTETFFAPQDKSQLPAATLSKQGLAEGLELRWFDSANEPKSCLIGKKPLKIGAGPKCEIRLVGNGLKPLHAVISTSQLGQVIRRWGTDTLLNGEDFQESLLAAGDQITIGSSALGIAKLEIAVPKPLCDEVPHATIPDDDCTRNYEVNKELEEISQLAGADYNESLETIPEIITDESTLTETVLSDAPALDENDLGSEHKSSYNATEKTSEGSAACEKAEESEHNTDNVEKSLSDIDSSTEQDRPLESEQASPESAAEWIESTQSWSVSELSLDSKDEEVSNDKAGTREELEETAEQDPKACELSLTTSEEIASVKDIHIANSPTSRDRLIGNYRRMKQLIRTLRTERTQLADTNSKIQLFADQLELLHQQITDSEAENQALSERILELENQLQSTYAQEQSETSETVSNDDSLLATTQPIETLRSELVADETDHYDSQEPAEERSESVGYDYASDESPLATDAGEPANDTDEYAIATDSLEEASGDHHATGAWDLEQQNQQETLQQHEITNLAQNDDVDEEQPSGSDAAESLSVGSLLAEYQESSEPQSSEQSETLAPTNLFDPEPGESEQKESFQPASFIEQFAHITSADEDRENEESFSVSEPIASDIIEPGTLTSESEAAFEEDEDAVDDYMEKMMARLRGETSSEPKKETSKTSREPKNSSYESESESSDSEEPKKAPVGPPITNLAELKGMDAPEINTDMAALRSLANVSARDAIEIARSRQWREKLTSKIVVIGIGFVGSVIGMITSPSLFGIQFLLSSCFAAMWGYIGLRSLLKVQTDMTLDTDLSQAKAIVNS